MANKYKTSTGELVSEATIKTRLSKMYKLLYQEEPIQSCQGCGDRAQGSAHIIPKARSKQLHKTELIWSPENVFPACIYCNTIAENPSSEEIKTLRNYDQILEVTRRYDQERYNLMI